MLVSDFNFELPQELIAQRPPEERGSSRMLRVDRQSGRCVDDQFRNLPQVLRPGDLLVLNDSRVLPARLFAHRARGARTQAGSPAPTGSIEVLLTERVAASEHNDWSVLVRPARKVQPGEQLIFADQAGAEVLRAEVIAGMVYGERTLRFAPEPDFLARLDRIGHMPLPPYMHRPDGEEDRSRYQTVYASAPGSAAAPTAGLHFTPEILAELEARGVETARITLHVGLGTFQPVRVERVEEIQLHTEHYTLPEYASAAIRRALGEGRRVIAAGTTTTRTLEHCAAIGNLDAHSGSTSIFIRPGDRFRVISGLLTNFHLPQSTLLMLVSAFLAPAGEPDRGRVTALAAYAHAVRERYRFFSYGDCMLIL